MPRDFGRHQRVASQLQQELAEIFQRQLRTPLRGLVTVRRVEVSRDLSLAKVYFGVLSGEPDTARKANLRILQEEKAHIRHILGKRLHMRIIPELEFIADTLLEQAMDVTAMLDELKPNA